MLTVYHEEFVGLRNAECRMYLETRWENDVSLVPTINLKVKKSKTR